MLAYVMLGFGLGLVIGYCLESWVICTCAAGGFLVLGFNGVWKK